MYGRDSRRNQGGNYNNHGYHNGNNNNRSGQARNHVIPNEPPFTAYIGNAPETMVQGDFEHQLFTGLRVKQVRLIRDRQTDRFRGFAYVDFEDADSLRSAIALDGTCVNDRPIRIDVASRTLGGTKSEGFRNKPSFESRQPSGNNTNRAPDGFRHYDNGSDYSNRSDSLQNSERQSQQDKKQTSPARKVSDNDVFIEPDTPVTNEKETKILPRLLSRNWADCPIDDSVVETSPPPSIINNTLTSDDTDDFQIVRNKNTKSRSNQHSSSHSMDNQSMRGRNSGLPSTGRTYYEHMPASYVNQTEQYYPQVLPPPLDMGLPYHNNRPSTESRQNSNRTNTGRNYRDDKQLSSATSSSHDITSNSISSENRPRLQLLPRSQKLSSSTDNTQTIEPVTRNANIFGCGKPRDEYDSKLVDLSKHIEEVVIKEQHLSRTTSTTSNGSTSSVTKPVRILKAGSEFPNDH